MSQEIKLTFITQIVKKIHREIGHLDRNISGGPKIEATLFDLLAPLKALIDLYAFWQRRKQRRKT